MKIKLPFICIVLMASVASTYTVRAQNTENKLTLAVLTLNAQQGITVQEAQILGDRLAIELNKTDQFTLINRQRMAEQLELQKFSLLSNCSASECAVEAGRLLGASLMVYGSIGKIGETFSLNTYLISVETGATLQSASTDVSNGIEELLISGITKNVTQLTSPKPTYLKSETHVRPTCAVLTFDSRGGVSLDEIRLFTDRFTIELDTMQQYTLVPRSKMESVLQEQQFARSDNCSAAECAIEAGKLLGVRYVAFGALGKIGALYAINSFLVDVESGAAIKTATTDFRGNKESVLTQGMRQNALSLLGITVQKSCLNIRVSPAHAHLTVNGQTRTPGRIHIPSETPITVIVRTNGYSTRTETHSVKAGETKDVHVQLSRNHTPFPTTKPKVKSPPKDRVRIKRPRVH